MRILSYRHKMAFMIALISKYFMMHDHLLDRANNWPIIRDFGRYYLRLHIYRGLDRRDYVTIVIHKISDRTDFEIFVH